MHPQDPIEQLATEAAARAAAVVAAASAAQQPSDDDGTSPSSTSGDDETAGLQRLPSGAAASQHVQPTRSAAGQQQFKDLSDVSHRLKRLEKAVKSHILQAPRSNSNSSILSAFAGSPSASGPQLAASAASASAAGGGFGSPMANSTGIRAPMHTGHLRTALSGIKAEVADLAAREVEGQLLQQRVSHLEGVINGMAGFAAGGLSFAGAGPVMGAAALRASTPPRLARAPSDVAVLAERLTDMEGLMKELAHAQVASTSVLQQIGSRLPQSLPQSPEGCPRAANTSGTGLAQPARPPSCPLIGGVLSSFGSPSPPRHRATTPDACCPASPHMHGPAAHLTDRSSFSPTSGGISSLAQMYPVMRQPMQCQWCAPPPQQQQQQVEVVLAAHDVELAGMRGSLCQLASEQQAAAVQMAGLSERVAAVEQAVAATASENGGNNQHTAAAAAAGCASGRSSLTAADTVVGSAVARVAEAWAAGVAGAVGVAGALAQEDIVSAIEGLAADAAQANTRLAQAEAVAGQHREQLQALQGANGQLQEQVQQLQGVTQGIAEQRAATPPAAAVPHEQLQEQLVQLLSSSQVQRLLDERVEQALQARLDQVLTARVQQEVASRLAEASAAACKAAFQQAAATVHDNAAGAASGQQLQLSAGALAGLALPEKFYSAESQLGLSPPSQPAQPACPAATDSLQQPEQCGRPLGAADELEQQQDGERPPLAAPAERLSRSSDTDNVAREDVPEEPTGVWQAATDSCDSLAAPAEDVAAVAGDGAGVSVGGIAAQALQHDGSSASPAQEESSYDILQQVCDLQQEMTGQQLQAMQAAIDELAKQLQSVAPLVTAQAAQLDAQRAATAAVHASLSPQVAELARQVAELHELATSQPPRIDVVQQEIEQLSQQLTEVNACAIDEEDLSDVRAQLQQLKAHQEQLQQGFEGQLQQLQHALATTASELADERSRRADEATAAAVATTADLAAAEADAGSSRSPAAASAAAAAAAQAAQAELLQDLEAAVQQQLASMAARLSALQQDVEQRVAATAAQAAEAAAAASEQAEAAEVLSQHASELSVKLQLLQESVNQGRAASDSALQQQVKELREAAQSHDAELSEQLRQQVDTMAHILVELGAAKAEQAAAAQQLQQRLDAVSAAQAAHQAAQAGLSSKLQEAAQQLRDELDAALQPVRQQLVAASQQLGEQGEAIEGCAKAAALAGVVATLRSLPGAMEGLAGRLDELAQAQRAAEGQLHAGQEHQLALQGQLAGVQAQLESVAGAIDGHGERLQAELLQLVARELGALQQQQEQLQQLQAQQAAAVDQLGALVQGVRGELLADLARDREQLALAIDELQSVVASRCIKTEQLGEIFAADVWQKVLQAVFEASSRSSHGGSSGSQLPDHALLFKVRPSETMSRLPSPAHRQQDSSAAVAAAASAAGAQLPDAAATAAVSAADAAAGGKKRRWSLPGRQRRLLAEAPQASAAEAAAAEAPSEPELDPFSVLAASDSQQLNSTSSDQQQQQQQPDLATTAAELAAGSCTAAEEPVASPAALAAEGAASLPHAPVQELSAVIEAQRVLDGKVLQLARVFGTAVEELTDKMTAFAQHQQMLQAGAAAAAAAAAVAAAAPHVSASDGGADGGVNGQPVQQVGLQAQATSLALQVDALEAQLQAQQACVAATTAEAPLADDASVSDEGAPAAVEAACEVAEPASAAGSAPTMPAEALQSLALLAEQVGVLTSQQAAVRQQLLEEQQGRPSTAAVDEVKSLCQDLQAETLSLSSQVAGMRDGLQQLEQLQERSSSALAADVTTLQAQQRELSTEVQALTQQLEQQSLAAAEAAQQDRAPAAEASAGRADSCADSFLTAVSASRAASFGSVGAGVLHAPLSLVVQLQQELAALRDGHVSREQFAAVVRMVKDLRRRSSSSATGDTTPSTPVAPPAAAAGSPRLPSPFSTAAANPDVEPASCGAAGPAAPGFCSPFAADAAGCCIESAVQAELQQHTERLVVLEQGLQSLMQRLETGEAAAQGLEAAVAAVREQQQQQAGMLGAAVQEAADQQAAALAARVDAAEQGMSGQHCALKADLASLCTVVDDLAAKLATAASAAAQSQRQYSDNAGSGFSDMVAGLANLKACLDQQGRSLGSLQDRLEVQEAAVGELAAAAQARAAAAAAVVEGLEGRRLSGSASGRLSASHSGGLDAAADAAGAGPSAAEPGADVLAELVQQVSSISARLSQLDRYQEQREQCVPLLQPQLSGRRAVTAAALAGSAAPASAAEGAVVPVLSVAAAATASSSAASSRRVSRACSVSGGAEAAASPASVAAAAVAGPMETVHQILLELKARVEKLESSATAAALCGGAVPGASAPSTPGRAGGVRRGTAWLQPATDGATLSELQELVGRLSSDVAQIAAENATFAGMIDALRGDVGAAAAAAAAAAQASEASAHPGDRPAGCEAMRSFGRNTSGLGRAADGAGAAAEALQAAAHAHAAAAQAQADLLDVSANLQHLKQALAAQAAQLAGLSQAAAAAAEAAAVSGAAAESAGAGLDALRAEVSAVKAQLDICSSSCADQPPPAATDADGGLMTQAFRAELLATAASQAAAAATCSTQELRAQIEELQQQLAELAADGQLMRQLTFALPLSRASTNGEAPAASAEAAAAVAAAAEAAHKAQQAQAHPGNDSAAAPRGSVAGATAGPSGCGSAAAGAFRHSLSFSELSALQAPSERDLTQHLWASAATEAAASGGPALDLTADDGAWFEHAFDDVDAQQQQQQQGTAQPAALAAAPQAAAVGAGGGAVAAAAGGGDGAAAPGQQLLAAQLALLAPAQQVSFLSKLAGVVSAHAGRLLATYQDDPEHCSQLQQVQERLASTAARLSSSSSAVSAPAAMAAGASSRHAAAAMVQFGRSSSMGVGQVAAGGSAEALLGILDQVATLRAIGSATHPAITEALQKHEDQIAALSRALQECQAAVAAKQQQQQPEQQHCSTSSTSSLSPSEALEVAATADGTETPPPAAAAATEAAEESPGPAAGPPAHGTRAPAATGLPDEAAAGEAGQRLTALESRLSGGLRVLSALRERLGPLQEVADATQSMMRELQVAHGLVLQRLEDLEGLAAAGAGAGGPGGAVKGDGGAGGSPGALAVAGAIRGLKDDVLQLARRLSSAEAKLASSSECLALSRRVAARLADADGRTAALAGKVSGVAGSLPLLAGKVGDLEGRLLRSVAIARRGLDVLADQLVALGAMSGRASPNKNPLAALGPNHAALTALESKLEAVRTAMTASVKLMMQDLAADAAAAGAPLRATPGLAPPDLSQGLLAAQAAAGEAAAAAAASHADALNGMEARMAELKAELQAALLANAGAAAKALQGGGAGTSG